MRSEHEPRPLILALPWPPSINDYWLRNKGGGVRVGEKGRQYRNDVAALLVGVRGFGDKARLSVDVELYPPDRRKRDVDNTWKALLDSLKSRKGFVGIYGDDGQIDATSNLRVGVERPGRALVRVAVLTESRAATGRALAMGAV